MSETWPEPRTARVYGVLALGVVAVSVAAPLIRAAQAPPLSIAAYRLLLAALPIAAFAALRRRTELSQLGRSDRRALLLAGLCLAAHFATWIASVKYVTVASSVALVTTSPLFVAAFALLFGGERTSRRMLLAIGICTLGGIVIGAADFGMGRRELAGDALALAGAGFAAGFLLLGRNVRARVSVVAYAAVVYSVAALVLLGLAVAAREPLSGFSIRTYLDVALLALVPQLLGHSALTWTLRFCSAHSVAIAVLGEPILATLLAAVFLREMPGLQRVLGAALLIAGVYLALIDERQHGGDARLGALAAEAG